MESTVDKGSTFWFSVTLPEGTPAAVVAPAPAQAVPRLDGVRVLLVDDSVLNQQLAATMLTKLGCQVHLAADGEEAIAAVSGGSYDLVLMDCHMPVMDGFEATQHIRRNEGPQRRTPIIAMTAAVFDSDRERCFEAGMDDFVSKPIDTQQFRRTLARWSRRDETAALPS